MVCRQRCSSGLAAPMAHEQPFLGLYDFDSPIGIYFRNPLFLLFHRIRPFFSKNRVFCLFSFGSHFESVDLSGLGTFRSGADIQISNGFFYGRSLPCGHENSFRMVSKGIGEGFGISRGSLGPGHGFAILAEGGKPNHSMGNSTFIGIGDCCSGGHLDDAAGARWSISDQRNKV